MRDLDAAALKLREVCEVLMDEGCEDAEVRAAIFARVDREEILAAMAQVESLARPPDDRYQKELVNRYRSVRRYLPTLLSTVKFDGTQAGQPVLRALDFLRRVEGKKRPDMSEAPVEFVPKAWQRLVIEDKKQVNLQAYTLCLQQRLQDSLRRRDVFVVRSDRWGDPRAKLLPGKEWESARPQVCRMLELPPIPSEELATLKATRRSLP